MVWNTDAFNTVMLSTHSCGKRIRHRTRVDFHGNLTLGCDAVAKKYEVCNGCLPSLRTPARKQEAAVLLKTAGNYVILAKSGISTTPGSTITGNIAVSPIAATAITGFALSWEGAARDKSVSDQVSGYCYSADYAGLASDNTAGVTPAALTQAVLDMEAAYTDAAGRLASKPENKEFMAGIISGATFTSGGDRRGIQTPSLPIWSQMPSPTQLMSEG